MRAIGTRGPGGRLPTSLVLVGVVLLSACNLSAVGAGAPTEVPRPALPATSTPIPIPFVLLLESDESGAVEPALRGWAQGRGWLVERRPASQAGLAEGLGLPGLAAIVSMGEVPGVRESFDGPVIVVNGQDDPTAGRLSTIGSPDARYDQLGFLAGALAGLVSRNWSVGLVTETGGAQETVIRAGFVHGLRYACPGCRLTELPVSQLSRDALVVQGVDVVFALPGPAAEEAAGSLEEAGFWVVWSGGDPAPASWDHLAGEIALTADGLIALALEALLAGSQGQAWPYSVENGSLAVSRLNPAALSPGRERLLQDLVAALSSDQLEIGIDPATGEER